MGAGEARLLDRGWRETLVIVRRSVDRLCRRWPAETRDDVLQDAMIRVFRASERHEADHLSNAYLHRAAYSAMIDEARRHQRRREVGLEESLTEVVYADPKSDEYAGPEEAAYLANLGSGIFDCLEGLRENRRAALVLHLKGYSAQEASVTLGWNLKKVRNLVARGRADLRACLHGKGLNESLEHNRQGAPCCSGLEDERRASRACSACLATRG